MLSMLRALSLSRERGAELNLLAAYYCTHFELSSDFSMTKVVSETSTYIGTHTGKKLKENESPTYVV